MSICIDASLIVQLVAGGQHKSRVIELWRAWHEDGHNIVAPTLLYYEVSNALHRYVVHDLMLVDEARDALAAAMDLDVTLIGDVELHKQALALASAHDLPATYDAHYLALSERLGADFWTADRRLAQSIQDAFPWVHPLA